eukprot:g4845.t1
MEEDTVVLGRGMHEENGHGRATAVARSSQKKSFIEQLEEAMARREELNAIRERVDTALSDYEEVSSASIFVDDGEQELGGSRRRRRKNRQRRMQEDEPNITFKARMEKCKAAVSQIQANFEEICDGRLEVLSETKTWFDEQAAEGDRQENFIRQIEGQITHSKTESIEENMMQKQMEDAKSLLDAQSKVVADKLRVVHKRMINAFREEAKALNVRAQAELQEVQQQLEASELAMTTMQQELTSKNTDVVMREAANAKLEESLERLQRMHTAERSRSLQSEKLCAETQAELGKVREKYRDAMHATKVLREKLQSTESEAKAQSEIITAKDEKLQKIDAELRKLRGRLQVSDIKLGVLEEKRRGLRDDNAQLRQRASRLAEESQAKSNEVLSAEEMAEGARSALQKQLDGAHAAVDRLSKLCLDTITNSYFAQAVRYEQDPLASDLKGNGDWGMLAGIGDVFTKFTSAVDAKMLQAKADAEDLDVAAEQDVRKLREVIGIHQDTIQQQQRELEIARAERKAAMQKQNDLTMSLQKLNEEARRSRGWATEVEADKGVLQVKYEKAVKDFAQATQRINELEQSLEKAQAEKMALQNKVRHQMSSKREDDLDRALIELATIKNEMSSRIQEVPKSGAMLVQADVDNSEKHMSSPQETLSKDSNTALEDSSTALEDLQPESTEGAITYAEGHVQESLTAKQHATVQTVQNDLPDARDAASSIPKVPSTRVREERDEPVDENYRSDTSRSRRDMAISPFPATAIETEDFGATANFVVAMKDIETAITPEPAVVLSQTILRKVNVPSTVVPCQSVGLQTTGLQSVLNLEPGPTRPTKTATTETDPADSVTEDTAIPAKDSGNTAEDTAEDIAMTTDSEYDGYFVKTEASLKTSENSDSLAESANASTENTAGTVDVSQLRTSIDDLNNVNRWLRRQRQRQETEILRLRECVANILTEKSRASHAHPGITNAAAVDTDAQQAVKNLEVMLQRQLEALQPARIWLRQAHRRLVVAAETEARLRHEHKCVVSGMKRGYKVLLGMLRKSRKRSKNPCLVAVSATMNDPHAEKARRAHRGRRKIRRVRKRPPSFKVFTSDIEKARLRAEIAWERKKQEIISSYATAILQRDEARYRPLTPVAIELGARKEPMEMRKSDKPHSKTARRNVDAMPSPFTPGAAPVLEGFTPHVLLDKVATKDSSRTEDQETKHHERHRKEGGSTEGTMPEEKPSTRMRPKGAKRLRLHPRPRTSNAVLGQRVSSQPMAQQTLTMRPDQSRPRHHRHRALNLPLQEARGNAKHLRRPQAKKLSTGTISNDK